MLINIKVTSGAKEDKIVQISKNHFNLRIKAEAKNMKANLSAIDIVAKYFKVSKNAVKIIHGLKSRSKIMSVRIANN